VSAASYSITVYPTAPPKTPLVPATRCGGSPIELSSRSFLQLRCNLSRTRYIERRGGASLAREKDEDEDVDDGEDFEEEDDW
jgi:hypothetical protein